MWSVPQLSCEESKGKYNSANSGITTSQTLKKPCIPVETAAKVLVSDTYESVEVKSLRSLICRNLSCACMLEDFASKGVIHVFEDV